MGDARTGHLDHHLSAAFQEIACLAFKVRFQKGQRAVRVIIDQNPHQLNQILVSQRKLHALFHPTPSLLPRNAWLCSSLSSAGRMDLHYPPPMIPNNRT
jgi:hypothetical protein